MAQTTINERLKFLIKTLGLSVRAFSAEMGVPDTNTRNYLDKGTKLNSEYIERIAHHFRQVNLSWLITGNGEPIMSGLSGTVEPLVSFQKNNYGNSVGKNSGTATQNNGAAGGDAAALALAQKEIDMLREQLAMKDALIASKDQTLSLLLGSQNRPN